jgi:hypothetical protein
LPPSLSSTIAIVNHRHRQPSPSSTIAIIRQPITISHNSIRLITGNYQLVGIQQFTSSST